MSLGFVCLLFFLYLLCRQFSPDARRPLNAGGYLCCSALRRPQTLVTYRCTRLLHRCDCVGAGVAVRRLFRLTWCSAVFSLVQPNAPSLSLTRRLLTSFPLQQLISQVFVQKGAGNQNTLAFAGMCREAGVMCVCCCYYRCVSSR